MDAIEMARLEQMENNIPDIYDPFGNMLYVGAGSYRHYFFEALKEAMIKVDVVEIEPKDCEWLRGNHPWLKSVICQDIRDFIYNTVDDDLGSFPGWDSILWSHGVEMLPKGEGLGIIKIMENFIKPGGIFVHMTPHGNAGGTGNISTWYPEDFEKLGYKTDCLGGRDERNSNLLAWKYIK